MQTLHSESETRIPKTYKIISTICEASLFYRIFARTFIYLTHIRLRE